MSSPEFASYILQILVSAFLAILFLQSGIDKVVDRRGNRAYLQAHFAKSPLAGTVGPMFLVITILEVAAGALSGVGCALLVLRHDPSVAFLGAVVGAVNLSALFFSGSACPRTTPGGALALARGYLSARRALAARISVSYQKGTPTTGRPFIPWAYAGAFTPAPHQGSVLAGLEIRPAAIIMGTYSLGLLRQAARDPIVVGVGALLAPGHLFHDPPTLFSPVL